MPLRLLMRRNTNPKWFRRTQFLMVSDASWSMTICRTSKLGENTVIAKYWDDCDRHQDHRELRELEEGWGETQGKVVDFLLKRWKPLEFLTFLDTKAFFQVSAELHRRWCNVGNRWVFYHIYLSNIIRKKNTSSVEFIQKFIAFYAGLLKTQCYHNKLMFPRSFEDKHNNVWWSWWSRTLPNVQPHEPLVQVGNTYFLYSFSWFIISYLFTSSNAKHTLYTQKK